MTLNLLVNNLGAIYSNGRHFQTKSPSVSTPMAVVSRRYYASLLILILCLGIINQVVSANSLANDQGGTYGWSLPKASAVAPVCLQFAVVGVCIWIVCYITCKTSVTIKYGHFNPEAAVEVTNPQGVDRVEDPKRIDTHNRNHNNLISQDAAVIGHPISGEIYCPSHATAGEFYFISRLDIPSWRWGGLDTLTLGAFIPGIHEIGAWPLNTWGALYPRTGWTLQSSQPKSAGVIAQRVGHIVTRTGETHIYNPITGGRIFVKNKKMTWAPRQGLIENTNRYGWFQPYSPNIEPRCVLFGDNDTLDLTDWGGGRVAAGGDYAFTLYRPYTCCEIKDGFLIDINFTQFPIKVVTN